MMKHPRIMNIVAGPGYGLLCGRGNGRALPAVDWPWNQPGAGQDAASNVARVSFVQGSVQLLAGQGANFEQAVMNMPVLDGSRLQTGGDGQAEVEFGDGSVARLTPNSSLQFGHLGQDQVQIQQLSGLGYYEFNVGEGHPPFDVQFANVDLQPTANSILRVGLDAGWEVAVISGSAARAGKRHCSGRRGGEPEHPCCWTTAGPRTPLAQGINGDSWDNWNQDRDQAIAQEAAQQTPVRDDSANPQNENWNDLDANGNWYPDEGAGNVWVPAGVGRGLGPVWVRLLGLLPDLRLHLGFGLSVGLAALPLRRLGLLLLRLGMGSGRLRRLASGDRGAQLPSGLEDAGAPGLSRPRASIRFPGKGWWRSIVGRWRRVHGRLAGRAPRPDHQQALNFNGRVVAPVGRVDVRSQAFTAAKGTAPGTRAVLSGAPVGWSSGRVSTAPMLGVRIRRGARTAYPQGAAQRPNVGYSPRRSPITSVRLTWPGRSRHRTIRRPPRLIIRRRRHRRICRLPGRTTRQVLPSGFYEAARDCRV